MGRREFTLHGPIDEGSPEEKRQDDEGRLPDEEVEALGNAPALEE